MSTLTIVSVADVPVNENGFYDEIEIEDMDFVEDSQTYFYPCPWYESLYLIHLIKRIFSGDKFEISLVSIRTHICSQIFQISFIIFKM